MEAGVLGNYCLSEHLLGHFLYHLCQNSHFLFFHDVPIPYDSLDHFLKVGI